MIAKLLFFLGALCSPALTLKKTVMVMTKGRNPVFDNEFDFEYTTAFESNTSINTLELRYDTFKNYNPNLDIKKVKETVENELMRSGHRIAVRNEIRGRESVVPTWEYITERSRVEFTMNSVSIQYKEAAEFPFFNYIRHRLYVMKSDEKQDKKYPIIDKSEIEFDVVSNEDIENIVFGDFRNLDKEELLTISENREDKKKEVEGTVDILKKLMKNKFVGYKVYMKSSPIQVKPKDGPVWWELSNLNAKLSADNPTFEISFNRVQYTLPHITKYRLKVMRHGDIPTKNASLLEFTCIGNISSEKSEFKVDTNAEALEVLVNHKAVGVLEDPTPETLAAKIQDLMDGKTKAFIVVNLLTTTIEKEKIQDAPNFQYLEGISFGASSDYLTIHFQTNSPYVLQMPKYKIKFLRTAEAHPDMAVTLFECYAHESTLYSMIQMTIMENFDAAKFSYCLQDWLEGKAFIAGKEDEENATWKMFMPPLDVINSLGSGVHSREIINPVNGIFHSREKCDWAKKNNLPVLFVDAQAFENLKLLPNSCSRLFYVQLCIQYFECVEVTEQDVTEELKSRVKANDFYHLVEPEYATGGKILHGNMIILKTKQTFKETKIGGMDQSLPELPGSLQQLTWELIIFAKEIYEIGLKSSAEQSEFTKTCTYDPVHGKLKVKRRVSDDDPTKMTVFIDVNNTLANCRSNEVDGWSKSFLSDSQKPGLYMQKFVALQEKLYKDLSILCEPYGDAQCVPYSTASGAFINVLVKIMQEKGQFFKEPLTQYHCRLIFTEFKVGKFFSLQIH